MRCSSVCARQAPCARALRPPSCAHRQHRRCERRWVVSAAGGEEDEAQAQGAGGGGGSSGKPPACSWSRLRAASNACLSSGISAQPHPAVASLPPLSVAPPHPPAPSRSSPPPCAPPPRPSPVSRCDAAGGGQRAHDRGPDDGDTAGAVPECGSGQGVGCALSRLQRALDAHTCATGLLCSHSPASLHA